MLRKLVYETRETLSAIRDAARAVEAWANAERLRTIHQRPDLYGPNGTEIRRPFGASTPNFGKPESRP